MIAFAVNAQSNESGDSGYVNIHADPRLATLVKKAEPKSERSAPHGPYKTKGFRVQIYNGSDRAKATDTKLKFLKGFPGTRAYLVYNSPNFRVRVGDYKTRNEAQAMLSRLSIYFNTAMIVPDMITITPSRAKAND